VCLVREDLTSLLDQRQHNSQFGVINNVSWEIYRSGPRWFVVKERGNFLSNFRASFWLGKGTDWLVYPAHAFYKDRPFLAARLNYNRSIDGIVEEWAPAHAAVVCDAIFSPWEDPDCHTIMATKIYNAILTYVATKQPLSSY